jgi:type IV pilus assembly protein PilO
MRMHSNRSRLILGALALAAVLVVLLSWFVGVGPQLTAVNKAKADLSQQKDRNDREQIAVQKLKSQHENLGALQAELQQYQQGVPSGLEESPLDRQIAAAAGASGATVADRTIGDIIAFTAPSWLSAPSVTGGTLVQVPVTIKALGNYGQQEAFVQALQTQARYITVSNVKYTLGTDNSVEVSGSTWLIKE